MNTWRNKISIIITIWILSFSPTVSIFATEITLKWDDNSDNENGFYIERSLVDGQFSLLGSVGANTTEFVIVADSAAAKYRVCAFNELGKSAYSNELLIGPNDSIRTYYDWVYEHFWDSGLNPEARDPDAEAPGGGMTNLEAYVAGSNPFAPELSRLMQTRFNFDQGIPTQEISRIVAKTAFGYTSTLQASNNTRDWVELAYEPTIVNETESEVTEAVRIPLIGSHKYYRIRTRLLQYDPSTFDF